ncbi:Predicted nucleotidyltransferase [Anoxynatronum buryatiense]|uniref:Predicted nucleotidyltransferase n=2 Tax=Anoxynatronum buryatiense TaxID=489973 RepID=A0AA46AJ22_9CLOT|nr:Predicted nucleotidyltransferase [Anoxynatronum buryatiense]
MIRAHRKSIEKAVMKMGDDPMDHEKDQVMCAIKKAIAEHDVKKVVLFGSRARGDHEETSDYDLAVFGEGLTAGEQALIREAMEAIHTLKKIDVVFVNEAIGEQLLKNIESEGVIIYEQIGKQTD